LIPAINKFPIEYQRRLRHYYARESLDGNILESIPENQFGVCLAFNFFEFKPFEILKKYLQEIYHKLKPGGVLIMSYNDCDRAHCVALVEAHFTCYTPGSMVKNFAESIGFEQLYHWNDRGNLTWLELRKPGTLSTLRGGQTLAKVVSK
jgi:SAM-dependent methyltransferase